jgi:hypothetical protein
LQRQQQQRQHDELMPNCQASVNVTVVIVLPDSAASSTRLFSFDDVRACAG